MTTPDLVPADLGALAGRSFDAVLFDMDGTLIDSTPSVTRSWRQWAAERGIDPGTWVFRHGVPARQILAEVVPPEELDAAFARIEAIELVALDGIVVLPGAVEALTALPAGRAAIATSCSRPLAQARIASTRLPVPDVVVTADDVAVGKPDPAPWLLAARRIGVDPARCLVVEDAPAGLAAARAAGAATLAVLTTHPAADLAADAVVTGLGDVRLGFSDGAVHLRPTLVP